MTLAIVNVFPDPVTPSRTWLNSPFFDEATSSVDTETEREIQTNLVNITNGKTALVIAHRLSTIRKADRIIVLSNGKVSEEGNHNELVSRNSTYSYLWKIQSGEISDGISDHD